MEQGSKADEIYAYMYVEINLNRDPRQRLKQNLRYDANYNALHSKVWITFSDVS